MMQNHRRPKILGRIRERKHRLERDQYLGPITVMFTICIGNRSVFFENEEIFNLFEQILLDAVKNNNCNADMYIFMPDHCHIILSGNDTNSDCLKAIIEFKQKTGYWLAKNRPEIKWQKNFYDRIIRKGDDLTNELRYIMYNPIRAGIVPTWKQYPYKGSTVYPLEDVDFEI